jgi:PTH1 family peptidyl-tRNA hydrolase
MPCIDWVIAGLGNPGQRYARTRHNIGFMVLDYVLDQRPGLISPLSQGKTQATCWRLETAKGQHILLVQPQTYMNLSGLAVRTVMTRYGLQPERLVVVHDELDLDLGKARVKFGGGLAGHNGLRSISAELGTREFFRLRLGIGRPDPGMDVTRHVLSPFLAWEEELVSGILKRAVKGLMLLCTHSTQASMNFLHSDSGLVSN